MKRSRRKLSIDVVIHTGIFKITIRSSPVSHLYLKQGFVFNVQTHPNRR